MERPKPRYTTVELMTSESDSIPSATKANACPMNPAVHLNKARTKLNPMPISEDFKPRWIICSWVCLLAIPFHYRQFIWLEETLFMNSRLRRHTSWENEGQEDIAQLEVDTWLVCQVTHSAGEQAVLGHYGVAIR